MARPIFTALACIMLLVQCSEPVTYAAAPDPIKDPFPPLSPAQPLIPPQTPLSPDIIPDQPGWIFSYHTPLQKVATIEASDIPAQAPIPEIEFSALSVDRLRGCVTQPGVENCQVAPGKHVLVFATYYQNDGKFTYMNLADVSFTADLEAGKTYQVEAALPKLVSGGLILMQRKVTMQVWLADSGGSLVTSPETVTLPYDHDP